VGEGEIKGVGSGGVGAKEGRRVVSDWITQEATDDKKRKNDDAKWIGIRFSRTMEGTHPTNASLPNQTNDTHITINTVLTTTLCAPPPNTGSAIIGKDSFTIIFARRRVTRRRCPFERMGLIRFA
jgi:hypothetical protein